MNSAVYTHLYIFILIFFLGVKVSERFCDGRSKEKREEVTSKNVSDVFSVVFNSFFTFCWSGKVLMTMGRI